MSALFARWSRFVGAMGWGAVAIAILASLPSCRPSRDRLQEAADTLRSTPEDTTGIPVPLVDSALVAAIRGRGPERGLWANALDVVQPPPPDSVKIAGRFANMYALSMRAYYLYYATALVHRRAAFDWQLRSAKISFCAVLILVLSGLIFAGIQFGRGKSDKASSIRLSSSGLEVSSPILGVVILALSLAFFYLYITHVYPIYEAIAGH